MRHSKSEIVSIIQKILSDYKVIAPPIQPDKIAESLGLEIVYKKFSDGVSGALILKQDSKPIIVVNEDHSPVRKRFTIAHELGHFILKHGRDGLFIDKKEHFIFRNELSATGEERQEVEANAFAAALLMPEEMVKREMAKLSSIGFDLYNDDEDGDLRIIKELAKKFKVSKAAMTFRIANLNLLDNY